MKKHGLLIALAVFSVALAASAVACSDNDDGGATAAEPAVTATAVAAPDRAEAPIDISGDWIVTVFLGGDSSGNPIGDCAATVTQAGTGLSMAVDCASLSFPVPGFQGTLSGTLDTATGAFSLSGTYANGVAQDFTGTASPDGNSITGSYTNRPGDASGTFDGVRQSAASGEAVQVTINEVGGSGVSGTATLVQTGQGLEVEMSVSGLTPGTYQAHMHPHPAGETCASIRQAQGMMYPPGAPRPTITVTDLDLTAVALPDLVVDGSGEAATTTTISLTGVVGISGAPVTSTLADFQDSNSTVEVYDFASGSLGRIACGDIPAS